jgi:Oxidoreductase family, NAD-binding Rossmann fold
MTTLHPRNSPMVFDRPKVIGIGLIGTGYAAKVRAEVVNAEPRAKLVGITGNRPDQTQAFATTHQTQVFPNWQALINHSEVQLVIISNLNSAHAEIARAALFAGNTSSSNILWRLMSPPPNRSCPWPRTRAACCMWNISKS